jgi:hypothetical protein
MREKPYGTRTEATTSRPGSARARRPAAARPPGGMPAAHGLAGDIELAGDLGLADADSEQLGGAQPAGLQPFTFMLCRRAARDGWHAPILTRRAAPVQLGDCQATLKTLSCKLQETGSASSRRAWPVAPIAVNSRRVSRNSASSPRTRASSSRMNGS